MALAAAGLQTLSSPACAQVQDDAAASPRDQVVITAQKKRELIIKAPLSVTAVQGEQLAEDGAYDITKLGALSPSAQFGKSASGQPVLAVRGIGSTDTTPNSDPTVSFNQDGIYRARGWSITGGLFDLDRVELLRGPQGTLYGRNATSGSVNIVTRAPVMGKLMGNASIDLGNYDAVTLNGAVNVPFGETFAIRAALTSQKRDGFGRNAPADDHFDADLTGARVRARWDVSEALRIDLGVDGSKEGGRGRAAKATTPVSSRDPTPSTRPGTRRPSSWAWTTTWTARPCCMPVSATATRRAATGRSRSTASSPPRTSGPRRSPPSRSAQRPPSWPASSRSASRCSAMTTATSRSRAGRCCRDRR